MSGKVLLSYYDILGVDKTADEPVIRRAHRSKAEIYHPDKVFHLGEKERKAAEMEMKLINNARDILLDPEQRSLYDQFLAGALEVEEVIEAFIIVEELEEERSPLWKKAMKNFSHRWGGRVDDIKKATGLSEEILEAREVLEVEPIEAGGNEKKGFDVLVVRPLSQEPSRKKKKKKPKPKEPVDEKKPKPPLSADEDFIE